MFFCVEEISYIFFTFDKNVNKLYFFLNKPLTIGVQRGKITT